MFVFKSVTPDSHPYVLSLRSEEFLHLYMVICSILSDDNSDDFLVDLESFMIDVL